MRPYRHAEPAYMLDDPFRRGRIVDQRAGPAERLPVRLQIRDVHSNSV